MKGGDKKNNTVCPGEFREAITFACRGELSPVPLVASLSQSYMITSQVPEWLVGVNSS